MKLNGYFLFDPNDRHNQQKVEVTVYLPKGTILYADKNTRSYHQNYSRQGDILDSGQEKHYLKVIDDDLICIDCSDDIKKLKKDDDETTKVITKKNKEEKNNIKIDSGSIKADTLNNN